MPRRPLTTIEVAEARLVFGDGFDYTRAGVFENARWPDLVDEFGAVLQRRKRGPGEHNAITLGSTSYFPVTLQISQVILARADLTHITWLMHELTHQWQFQRLGWRYLYSALGSQLREGRQSYNYQRKHASREDALREAKSVGRRLFDFNLEQQGDLARDYYVALKRGQDSSPWEPFVEEFRRA